MQIPTKEKDVVTFDRGSDNEVTLDLSRTIDCSHLPPSAESDVCMQLARVLGDRVAKGERFLLTRAPESLIREFRRAAERRSIKVYAGLQRNEYGETVGLGHNEFRLKDA